MLNVDKREVTKTLRNGRENTGSGGFSGSVISSAGAGGTGVSGTSGTSGFGTNGTSGTCGVSGTSGKSGSSGTSATLTDTLATVTARGASTTLGISTGNISVKDLLTIAATSGTTNYINSLQPLNIKSNGIDKILINDTTVTAYNDLTVNKTNSTLILSSSTQTTEKIVFSDNGNTELEIGHDGINLDETYLNAHKPFSFKYDGVEKANLNSGGFIIPTTNVVKTLALNQSTGANTEAVTLSGLSFSYLANSIYYIDIRGSVTSDANTTGCAFLFDTSTVVAQISLQFIHQLATSGTITGGYSNFDNTSDAASSGVPSTGIIPVMGWAMIRTQGNSGTAQLMFRSETTAVTTCNNGTTIFIQKIV
jgi:hypothetical protein